MISTEASSLVPPQENENSKTLTEYRAAFIIMAEMMGAGVLTLPHAVATSGWLLYNLFFA